MQTAHTPETKAAVLAALASGQSVNSIARQYGVSRSTVMGWRDKAQLPTTADVGQQKKEAIGEQVYGLLEDSIESLRAIVRFARNEEWLKQQTANDLAVFTGVLNDKTVRLLAALKPEGDAPHV